MKVGNNIRVLYKDRTLHTGLVTEIDEDNLQVKVALKEFTWPVTFSLSSGKLLTDSKTVKKVIDNLPLTSHKVYLASGWFNKNQMLQCKIAEAIIESSEMEHFFPRTMNLGQDGVDWKLIFDKNIEELQNCNVLVCVTTDKDMGAIWEAGYASALGSRIIYYTPGIDKPNLMLGMSGQIAKTPEQLLECLKDETVSFHKGEYE